MINKLHLAMIELYSGDAKRIQHFCKVHSYAKLIGESENLQYIDATLDKNKITGNNSATEYGSLFNRK